MNPASCGSTVSVSISPGEPYLLSISVGSVPTHPTCVAGGSETMGTWQAVLWPPRAPPRLLWRTSRSGPSGSESQRKMRVTMRRCVRRRCYSLVVEQKRRSMVIYKCPLTWVLEIINGEPGREFFGRRTWTNIGTYVSVYVWFVCACVFAIG